MKLPRYRPMLATLREQPFSDPEWSFEPKWDGVRTLLYWDGAATTLVSRRGNDVTLKYPELGGFRSGQPCVLDGEIIALDASGTPSFERLQSRMTQQGPAAVAKAAERVPVAYVAFDVLFDGEEVVELALEERRHRLDAMELAEPFIPTDLVDEDGMALWAVVTEHNLEGMVAKRLGSPYRPGVRTTDWLKIPQVLSVRAVVGGFTPGGGGRSETFGSLLVGLWTDAGLRWVGSVGTGFSTEALVEIGRALSGQTVDASPFLPDPALPSEARWVEPNLVALVGYKEWTLVGRLRAPRFFGFTADDPALVTWEQEGP